MDCYYSKCKLLWKLSFDDKSLTKHHETEKTLIEWFWQALAWVRLTNSSQISKSDVERYNNLLIILKMHQIIIRIPLQQFSSRQLIMPNCLYHTALPSDSNFHHGQQSYFSNHFYYWSLTENQLHGFQLSERSGLLLSHE